jgi:hypothetical protein
MILVERGKKDKIRLGKCTFGVAIKRRILFIYNVPT